MRPWLRSNRGPLGALCIVIVGFLVAILITLFTAGPAPRPQVVRLGKAATAYRAPSTGGAFGISPIVAYALRHHHGCGHAVNQAHLDHHGVGRQRFQHCKLAERVSVYRLPRATPQPTHTSSVPATPPSPVVPSATTAPIALPTDTAPSISANDPASYELSLMNATRAQYGLPPYSLDAVQSNGTASCGGSIGHSQDMAASGTIWHVSAAYPAESFPNNFCGSGYRALGENVGMAGGYSVNGALDVIHSSMMAEPHSPGCQGNHACSIISSQYTRVGIGVYTSGGATWLTVDFEG